jgi:hypothetical protein
LLKDFWERRGGCFWWKLRWRNGLCIGIRLAEGRRLELKLELKKMAMERKRIDD